MIKTTECNSEKQKPQTNIANLNKIVIDADGCIQIPSPYMRKQKGSVEALMFQTDYGYKIISLVPDVKKIYIECTDCKQLDGCRYR